MPAHRPVPTGARNASALPDAAGLVVVLYHPWGDADGAGAGRRTLSACTAHDHATFLLEAHATLGNTLFVQGEYAAAQTHLEQGLALGDLAAALALWALLRQRYGV